MSSVGVFTSLLRSQIDSASADLAARVDSSMTYEDVCRMAYIAGLAHGARIVLSPDSNSEVPTNRDDFRVLTSMSGNYERLLSASAMVNHPAGTSLGVSYGK